MAEDAGRKEASLHWASACGDLWACRGHPWVQRHEEGPLQSSRMVTPGAAGTTPTTAGRTGIEERGEFLFKPVHLLGTPVPPSISSLFFLLQPHLPFPISPLISSPLALLLRVPGGLGSWERVSWEVPFSGRMLTDSVPPLDPRNGRDRRQCEIAQPSLT